MIVFLALNLLLGARLYLAWSMPTSMPNSTREPCFSSRWPEDLRQWYPICWIRFFLPVQENNVFLKMVLFLPLFLHHEDWKLDCFFFPNRYHSASFFPLDPIDFFEQDTNIKGNLFLVDKLRYGWMIYFF